MKAFTRNVTLLSAGVVGTLSVVAAPASAAVSFQYRAEVPAYTAQGAGAPVQVPLYLYETRSAGDTSILNGVGLYSAGFQTTKVSNAGTGIATIAQSITANSAKFPGNSTRSFTAAQATIEENVGNNLSGATGDTVDPLTNRLFVGTLSLTGGSAAGVTTFSIADTGLTLRNDTGEAVNATGSNFAVTTAVPEPTTLAATAAVGSLLALRRRRA